VAKIIFKIFSICGFKKELDEISNQTNVFFLQIFLNFNCSIAKVRDVGVPISHGLRGFSQKIKNTVFQTQKPI
jgi:hypothetical protein